MIQHFTFAIWKTLSRFEYWVYNKPYNMYADTKESYLNINSHDYWDKKAGFLDKYALFIIDMSYKYENIKDAAINVRITFTFKNRTPQNTLVHCILLN